MTSHGSPLGPAGGSHNVWIGGQPAWRVLVDAHTCPQVSGLVPHVGGVVLMGSRSVFINKMPAVRMGDQIVEAGPSNAITVGCPTVKIGG
jgi:uncharacterized Zn-binding protein involved in type VI secretion